MKRKTKSSLITKYSPLSNRGGKNPLVGLNGVFDPDSFFMLVCHEASFITHCSKSLFFVQKINFDSPRKLSNFLWVETRENVVILTF